jgi:hypothetical protein
MPPPLQRLAFSALFLAAVAALVVAVGASMGLPFSPLLGLTALGVSGLLFAGLAWLHEAVRAARWNAGHRLR